MPKKIGHWIRLVWKKCPLSKAPHGPWPCKPYGIPRPYGPLKTSNRVGTLESWIDVGQGITLGPGKFVKNNKRRAWSKCANLCYKKPIKLENICRPRKKFQNLINVEPLIRL